MLYLNALEEWGWLAPSEWINLSLEERALLAELQTYIGKQRKALMKK